MDLCTVKGILNTSYSWHLLADSQKKSLKNCVNCLGRYIWPLFAVCLESLKRVQLLYNCHSSVTLKIDTTS